MADPLTSTDVVPEHAQTSLGPVEYIDHGSGEPVLCVHGSPGGCDQGVLLSEFVARAGFRVITPSRPGYLGTPLTESNASPVAQADLWLALMDQLDIDRFAVLAWSGGGPSTYWLAAHHPDRVRALVELAAVSRAYSFNGSIDERILSTGFGRFVIDQLAKRSPKKLVASTLATEGDLPKPALQQLIEHVNADPVKQAFVLGLAKSVTGRKVGFSNDERQFPQMPDLGLGKIRVPTLLVHGTADADVSHEYSQFAASQIPNSRLELVANGTHLAVWTDPDAEKIQADIIATLRG